MKLSERQQTLLFGALVTLMLVAGGCGLTAGKSLERLELVIYDMLLPFHANPMSEQVVLVAIDDASLAQLGQWPWSRRRHAELVDRLSTMGARAIGIDVLFAERQQGDPQADEVFARALERSGRTVLAVAPTLPTPNDLIAEILPLPVLASSAAVIGHVDVELDIDGLCRRVFLYSGLADARWPAFALAMLQVTGEAPPLSDLGLPTAADEAVSPYWRRNHSMLIPFARRGERPLTLSYADVLAGRVADSKVQGKYVLVGATATGLGDAISTPGSESHQRMPGVELNAHILNGLIQGSGIRPVLQNTQLLLTATLVLAAGIMVIWLPLRLGLLITLVNLALLPVLSLSLLVGWQLWFSPAAAMLMIALAWPLWNLWQLGVDARLRQRLLQRLEHQALHHMATGLPNHGMLEDRLRTLTSTQGAAAGVAGLMVMHLNWPGSASIMLGRPIGDNVLKSIGQRLREAVEGEHFIAHLNGDDFAVLLTEREDALSIQRAAVTFLGKLQQPLNPGKEPLLLTPQIGVSIWPVDGVDAGSLLRNAYAAMFKSRIDDTDHLCIYSADIGHQLLIRSQLEQALIHALERNEFEVHYQPQVDAKNGRIVGVEALLRWHNPQLGWVGPDAFIPVAEHVGLINAIGNWVLDTTCRQLHSWRLEGLGRLRLAVNVSPLQFLDPGLDDSIRVIIEQAGIDPSCLELEITESSLMRDVDSAVDLMRRIKRQGMELAIDDFGTGYSSLNSLRHFPLDRLKIDQSFTRDIGKSADATEITLTILAMGKRLGLDVVAEGVETAAQAEFLQLHGCDELQGFYYSRAVPAHELAVLLRDGFK